MGIFLPACQRWVFNSDALVGMVELITVLEVVLFQNCFQQVQCLVDSCSVSIAFVKPKFSDTEDVLMAS